MIITSGSATSGSTSPILEPEPLPDFPGWIDDSEDGTEESSLVNKNREVMFFNIRSFSSTMRDRYEYIIIWY